MAPPQNKKLKPTNQQNPTNIHQCWNMLFRLPKKHVKTHLTKHLLLILPKTRRQRRELFLVGQLPARAQRFGRPQPQRRFGSLEEGEEPPRMFKWFWMVLVCYSLGLVFWPHFAMFMLVLASESQLLFGPSLILSPVKLDGWWQMAINKR